MHFEQKLVFLYLIKNYLSLISLSERIESFNYGYIQRRNRPSGLNCMTLVIVSASMPFSHGASYATLH